MAATAAEGETPPGAISTPQTPTPPASFDEVLEHETRHVQASRQRFRVAPDAPLATLALSGGGIRSATFNLGLIQAFAEAGKLHRFDYLSTVSGGGYIGGWLTAWIHRKGLAEVESRLAASVNSQGSEPREVRWLRAHSNYLTPRKGLLSIDTLWGACTYLRNLVINQLLLISVVLSFLVTGAMSHAWLANVCYEHPAAVLVVGAVLLMISAPVVGFEFAHLRGQEPRAFARRLACGLRKASSHWIVAGLTVAGAAITAYALAMGGERVTGDLSVGLTAGAVFAAYWLLAALSVAAAFEKASHPPLANTARPEWIWLFWLLLASVLYGYLVDAYATEFPKHAARYPWLVPLLGPVLYIATIEIGALALIALAGRTLRAFAHDWLSRLAALIITICMLPSVVFGSWILLPGTIDYLATALPLILSGITAGWVASTALGVLGGKSAGTGTPASNRWVELLLALTPYIFAVGLLALLVWGTRELLWWTTSFQEPFQQSVSTWSGGLRRNLEILARIPLEYWIVASMVLMAVAALLAWRVDINLFSFHSYYRNRLSHAYLGASAEKRRANDFTGYAPEDSPLLRDLEHMAPDGKEIRPYPIINTALNLGGNPRMEWQQRKAASFVFTPLYCGFELPAPISENRDNSECGGGQPADESPLCAHRRTGTFVGGLPGRQIGHSLAITISGAAASPNMGYHTSPALAALMTAFNVRLGWWMPNPRFFHPWNEGGPGFSSVWMAKELAASATAGDDYVYLSDGGHFENLGVYEALRRRCKLIVASDASADPPFHFEDLANLVHKARADLGIEIKADAVCIRPEVTAGGVIGASKANHVIAEVVYPPQKAGSRPETGWLVYVKSSLPTQLPPDVENYRISMPGFPHQSTADQWFDESQFEAYRRLGLELGRIVVADLAKAKPEPALGW